MVSFATIDIKILSKLAEVGGEFEMPTLVKCCLQLMNHKLLRMNHKGRVDNVKDAIAVAYTYKERGREEYTMSVMLTDYCFASRLWETCVEIVRKETLEVLLKKAEFASLPNESPKLWELLVNDCKNDCKNLKRKALIAKYK